MSSLIEKPGNYLTKGGAIIHIAKVGNCNRLWSKASNGVTYFNADGHLEGVGTRTCKKTIVKYLGSNPLQQREEATEL